MDVDPGVMQRVVLMVAVVVAVVMLVGAAIYGWIRPAGTVGQSKIVMDRALGTLYVTVDGRLHPVENLVSARLIVGTPDSPTLVSGEEVAKWAKGPLVGIVGAPSETPRVLSPDVARWSVCDTASDAVDGVPVVTGIDGALTLGRGASDLGENQGVLLSYEKQVYLVAGGRRMPIDLSVSAVTSALGITGGAPPVPVMSRALFDAIPAGGALVVPQVPDAGKPARAELGPGVVIGSVIASQDVAHGGADQFYVAVGDGVQLVSPVVAAILRQHDSYGAATPPHVPPDRLAQVPVRHVLDVDYYPDRPVTLVDPAAQPVTCVSWQWGVSERQARLSLITGRALPIAVGQQQKFVRLVGGGHNGIEANQVLLSDDAATFVTTTGQALDSPARQTLWLISETGVRYGVPFDQSSLNALGLDLHRVKSAPWAMLQVWPAGPELSQAAAKVEHDSLGGAAAPIVTNQQQAGG
jgi:type VII secretion protein EccB